MPDTLHEFRTKFRVEELLVHRNASWSLSVRPGACTLGACVLSANRAHDSLGGIDAQEAADLAAAVAWFEVRARAVFAADRFNYLALMMVDPHLHFHALPRYAAARTFAGLTWQDAGWPRTPELGVDQAVGDAVARIRDALAAEPR